MLPGGSCGWRSRGQLGKSAGKGSARRARRRARLLEAASGRGIPGALGSCPVPRGIGARSVGTRGRFAGPWLCFCGGEGVRAGPCHAAASQPRWGPRTHMSSCHTGGDSIRSDEGALGVRLPPRTGTFGGKKGESITSVVFSRVMAGSPDSEGEGLEIFLHRSADFSIFVTDALPKRDGGTGRAGCRG